MPLSRASTAHSLASDVDSLDATPILSTEHRIIEITAQPDFYIFTSMLWVRTPGHDLDVLNSTDGTYHDEASQFKAVVPDKLQPDLGLLSYHRDRLVAAAEALRWRHIQAVEQSEYGLDVLRSSIALYLRCLPPLPFDRIERRKLRAAINKLGSIRIDSTVIDCPLAAELQLKPPMLIPETLDLPKEEDGQIQTHEKPVRDYKLSQVFLDSQPTRASIFTTHKTSYRVEYNRARIRARITASLPTDKEVLIYNKNSEIMEASLSTVYFQRDGKWITPAVICGGNLGVTRRLALEMNLCIQGSVEISEVEDGERLWLSNGARGFFMGQICLERRNPPSVSECDAGP